MRRLLFSISAQRDIGEIRKYIRRQSRNDKTARAFADLLQQQCQKLAALPGTLGRPRPEIRPALRSFPYKGYIIFFRYLPDTFEVVNILEGHRDLPTYVSENPQTDD